MSSILPYQVQKGRKRIRIANENSPKNNFFGANLLDEYKLWQGQRQIKPVIGNDALQSPFEMFMRERTGNTDDSIDKIMFENGGEYLWKNPSLITKLTFQLFFPGMNYMPETNFEAYKKFKNAFLSQKNGSFNFNYFNVSFGVKISFDNYDCEFKLYLKDMIETDGENVRIIALDYSKTKKSLYIDSFFDMDLYDCKLVFMNKDKLVGYEKRKGALQKRGFLYIRLITNLIRSTGSSLDKLFLIDAWEPMKGKIPRDRDEWQEYIKDKKWQGDFMGNGKMGSAKDIEYHGFYATFMKAKEQPRSVATKYFEPWISGTATQF